MHVEKIHFLKKLCQQRRLDFSEDGKCVIRPELVIDNELLKSFNSGTPNQALISRQLLCPDDRIVRSNLLQWANDLNAKILPYLSTKELDLNLSAICNMAALVCSLAGNTLLARKLSEKQIALAIAAASHDPKAYRFILQPWINLSRLDRLAGQHTEALHKIELLGQLRFNDQIKMSKLDFLKLLINHPEFFKLYKACQIVEPIKIYLHSHQYYELIEFVNTLSLTKQHAVFPLTLESLVIALLNTHQYKQAYHVIQTARRTLPANFEAIFLLRLAELYADSNRTKSKLLLKRLLNFVKYQLNNHTTLHLGLFSYQLGMVANEHHHPELALEAQWLAFQVATEFQDEPLSIQALMQIQNLNPTTQHRTQLSKLIQQTDYHFIKPSTDTSIPLQHSLAILYEAINAI